MDKLILNADKNADKWGPCSPSLAIAGFACGAYRVRVPLLAHNINDLAPKTVWTSVDITSKCGQSVDKIRMELGILLGGCLTVKN